MATIDFKTQSLADLYLGTGKGMEALLTAFRAAPTGTPPGPDEVASLDNRIAAFQSAITDGAKVTGSEEFPYDKTLLKREFMNEVLAALLRKGYTSNFNNVFTSTITPPINNVSPVASTGLLMGKIYAGSAVANAKVPPFYTQGALLWDGGNFDNMTEAQVKSGLSSNGDGIYDAYSAWIDGVFAEGNLVANNPTDPATGTSIVSKVVTSIPERTINGVTYDRVTSEPVVGSDGKQTTDADGNLVFKTYLVAEGVQFYQGQKVKNLGYRADGTTGKSAAVTVGAGVDSSIGLTPNLSVGPLPTATLLEVDKDLNPIPGGLGIVTRQRNLSPIWYLYFWNEARVRVLRGQLNYLDAVATEIKDDLIKAQTAFKDLEAQAGKTRTQSADGKEVNPDGSDETAAMDYFEATNSVTDKSASPARTQLFDTDATSVLVQADKADRKTADVSGGDTHNYSQWSSNRSALKSYIDRKSTDAQRATQDYQGLLNKFNSAYEVMSKLQEKIDGLVKSQLRNVL